MNDGDISTTIDETWIAVSELALCRAPHYIQLYNGDANLLKESLEVVQRTSAASTPEAKEVLQ
jgi:hypothetical protein